MQLLGSQGRNREAKEGPAKENMQQSPAASFVPRAGEV